MISALIRRRIKQLHAKGMTTRAIATAVGVGQTTVWNIANGFHYDKIPREPKSPLIPKPDWLLRNCLKCGREFTARGRYIRICHRCKDTDEWQAGVNYPVIRE